MINAGKYVKKRIEVNKFNKKDILEKVFNYIQPEFVNKTKFKFDDSVPIANKKATFSNK